MRNIHILKLMKQNERVLISKKFNIKENQLTNLIGILAHTRNLCAHDERLYNYIFPTKETIYDNEIHQKLEIPIKNGRYIYGKNDLFAVMISLKILLSKEEYDKFHSKIFSRIMSLKTKLKVIDLIEVLETMNFPYNWHKLKSLRSTRDT